MKNRKAHRRLTEVIFPQYPDELIDRINAVLNNPTQWDKLIENAGVGTFGNVWELPLSKQCHRAFNRNLISALFLCYQAGGCQKDQYCEKK